ncbi:MAG: hypothetical protein HY849_00775 [Nitrosomonadales bacterium]|nr:hypothetical protein [Nitrosomonadales bacterium]
MTRRKLTPAERAKRSRRETAMHRRWIEPLAFQDIRKEACMSRLEAAQALDVTSRTIQNWETGGARIPWMAFRMLRILSGYALPGSDWEGWTVRGSLLIAPTGFSYDAVSLEQIQYVFAQARLWRQASARRSQPTPVSTVLPFPDRRKQLEDESRPTVGQSLRIGGLK